MTAYDPGAATHPACTGAPGDIPSRPTIRRSVTRPSYISHQWTEACWKYNWIRHQRKSHTVHRNWRTPTVNMGSEDTTTN